MHDDILIIQSTATLFGIQFNYIDCIGFW